MKAVLKMLVMFTRFSSLFFFIFINDILEARASLSKERQLESYRSYLPREVLKDLAPELSLAVEEAARNPAASLTFQSAESSWASAGPIMNQVSLRSSDRFDIWLLRQRQSSDQGLDPRRWHFFAIVLDRRPSPKIAYFLQFAPEAPASGALPRTIDLSVSCTRCHANGPRRIRPEPSTLAPAFTGAELQRLRSWNERIERDGPVEQVEHFSAATESPAERQKESEVLTLPACSECHAKASGIRSELRRAHTQSIQFLLQFSDRPDGYSSKVHGQEKGAMPLEDKLSAKEHTCLAQWLRSRPLAADCWAPEAKPDDRQKASLAVEVKSSLASFRITDIYLEGELQENGPSVIKVITQEAKSGSRLRDKHMQERFLAAAGPITLRIESLPPRGASEGELPLSLSWNGITRLVPVKFRFASGTYAIDAEIDMRLFGLDPPQFLGLSVKPELKVSGQLGIQSRFEAAAASQD